jgi:glycosyltransferase involved in cell wall biosynthesis
VVCSASDQDRQRLLQLAEEAGLESDELLVVGFVSDDDLLVFYNACKLFVFPSCHEGFGLPVLEAMACGRAVIGANISSIPELIGREDALFNPFQDETIALKIEEVLTNDQYRADLERAGLGQASKFSWERTACRTWQALKACVASRSRPGAMAAPALPATARRPRLAFVSPLPPERSGIADYSAELLPELAQHYEIEVVAPQSEVSDPWVRDNIPIRDVPWFHAHAGRFDRVLYQFGNSPFHSHMFGLMREFPGVVVLHDFFLSAVIAYMDIHGQMPGGWARALVHAHGWPALQTRYQAKDIADVIYAYPCNLEVLQQARGIVVHSEHSRQLARHWYGADAADRWVVIPLLRVPAVKTDRRKARECLGIGADEFLVCSFGMVAPTKLNHRLLDAWLASPLAQDCHCRLVFVGEMEGGKYGADLTRLMRENTATSRIESTGWVDAENYRTWLAAADMAVQLRALSRGETSAAVLDCMKLGLPTIVNANGSMADLRADAVWMLPDQFGDDELVEALATLWRDADRRRTLGLRAREVTHTYHHPRRCAEQYAQAIEHFYQTASGGVPLLAQALANTEPDLAAEDWPRLATVLANSFPQQPRQKHLFLDVSGLVQLEPKPEAQDVARALLREFLSRPPEGWIVEPVYAASDASAYRCARRFTSRFLDVPEEWAEDDLADAQTGDVFLGLEPRPDASPARKDHLLAWHRRGINTFFVEYDLFPNLQLRGFPEGAQTRFECRLETISLHSGGPR